MSKHPLIEHLKGLAERDDRGALAALRRGLGQPPGAAPEMHPHVLPYIGTEKWTWNEQCCYIVAALFGLYPDRPWGQQGNLGDTFQGIASAQTGRLGEAPESVERRFVTLLKAHRDDVFDHLRHAVSLAAARDVPVHWEQLLHDIRRWQSEDRWVQRNWARAFWGQSPAASEPEQTEQTTATGE